MRFVSVNLQESSIELTYSDPFDQTSDVVGVRLLSIENRLIQDQREELEDVLGDILQIAKENLRTGGSDFAPNRDSGGNPSDG